jgi:thiol-disulfide isomerase/thioredoxin
MFHKTWIVFFFNHVKENYPIIEASFNNRAIKSLLYDKNNIEFSFENLIDQNRGKVILIDFWATWCPPCFKEMPK